MNSHCLHLNGPVDESNEFTKRYCCWCDLTQHQMFEVEPLHGPRFEDNRLQWYWEPSSMEDCPRRITLHLRHAESA